MGYGMFDFLEAVFPIMFIIVFVMVIGVFLTTFIKGVGTWNQNNHSPRLSVEAEVVAKRADFSSSRHANAGDISGAHGYHTSSYTSYYVTFQVESGDRMEFCVSGQEYGLLVEQDHGTLSFQGTRYLGFVRR